MSRQWWQWLRCDPVALAAALSAISGMSGAPILWLPELMELDAEEPVDEPAPASTCR